MQLVSTEVVLRQVGLVVLFSLSCVSAETLVVSGDKCECSVAAGFNPMCFGAKSWVVARREPRVVFCFRLFMSNMRP